MQKLILLSLILSSSILFSQNTEVEQEAIKKVIQTAYVEGLQNEGNADKIDSGIHPDFVLLGVDKDNEMWKYTITDWKAKVLERREKGELPKSGDQLVSVKFVTIDVTGNAAMVKLEFYVGTKLTYIDYISLYKFENGWKMVNKIFYKI